MKKLGRQSEYFGALSDKAAHICLLIGCRSALCGVMFAMKNSARDTYAGHALAGARLFLIK